MSLGVLFIVFFFQDAGYDSYRRKRCDSRLAFVAFLFGDLLSDDSMDAGSFSLRFFIFFAEVF